MFERVTWVWAQVHAWLNDDNNVVFVVIEALGPWGCAVHTGDEWGKLSGGGLTRQVLPPLPFPSSPSLLSVLLSLLAVPSQMCETDKLIGFCCCVR